MNITLHSYAFRLATLLFFTGYLSLAGTTKLHAACDPAISGTVYVGSGSGTPQYATFQDLFDAINTSGLDGDLLVLVQNNITETALAELDAVNYCGASSYEIRIQPATEGEYTISSSASSHLLWLEGISNLYIDGSYLNDGGRHLRFRNIATNMSALVLAGGTNSCEFRNCIFEASGSGAAVIRLGAASGGSAITNILLDDNHIRNRSDVSQTAANQMRIGIISIGGSESELNEHITISNNWFSDFVQSGVDIGLQTSTASPGNLEYYLGSSAYNGTNNGSYFTIDNNRFFAPTILSQDFPCIPIKFNPGASSHSNSISGNTIGGNSSDNSGTLTYSAPNGFSGIYISVGGSSDEDATVISGNTISGINMTSTTQTWSRFVGIELVGASRVKIEGNTIGSLNTVNSITSSANGFNNYQFVSFVYGIWNVSSQYVEIENNTIGNITSTASSGGSIMSGIRNGARENFNGVAPVTLINIPSGRVKVNNNIVTAITGPSKGWRNTGTNMAPSHPGAISGIVVMSNSEELEVIGNEIYNLHNTVAGSNNTATTVVGLAMDGSGPAGVASAGIVSGNRIYNLINDHINNSNAIERPEIIGMSLGMLIGVTISGTTQGRGSYHVVNNMISLAPENGSNSVEVVGIMDQIQQGTTHIYHNSVYIGGQGGNALAPSAAYFHYPNRNKAGIDGEVHLKNNIFINERSGMTNSFAVAALVNADINSASERDYNVLASFSSDYLGSWQGITGGMATWQTNSGGDANSSSPLAIASGNSTSSELNASELFVDIPSADLHLVSPPIEPWPINFVAGQGTPIAEVSIDIDGDPRSSSAPYIGADEFYEVECIAPSVSEVNNTETICAGDNLTLSATTQGTSVQQQWQVLNGGNWEDLSNGTDYSGVTTSTLNIIAASSSLSGNQYRLHVSNACGDITSDVITITVNEGQTYYPDADNDSHGSPIGAITACEQPAGYVTSNNDCDDTDPLIWLAKPAEIVFSFAGNEVCLDEDPFSLSDSVTPDGGNWSGTGVSGSTFTATDAGVGNHTLTYFVAGDGACILPATGTVILSVVICTAVNELSTSDISLFPSLAQTHIEIHGNGLSELNILDMNGKTILSKMLSGNSHIEDISSLAAGNYLFTIRSSEGGQVFKVMKTE